MEKGWNKLSVRLSEPVLKTLKELDFKETTPVQVVYFALFSMLCDGYKLSLILELPFFMFY